MHLTNRHRPGQTMLEAIVAIGVILTAVIGSSTLILSSITAGRVSQNKVEAANFAREGVEAVRALRDNNWLKFEQNEIDVSTGVPPTWNDSILTVLDSPIRRMVRFTHGTKNSWALSNCPGGNCTTVNTRIYRVKATNVIGVNTIDRNFFAQYSGLSTCQVSGRVCVATKYSRIVTITLKNDGGSDPEDEYLLVESAVTWPDRTGTKSLVAQTRLYDWK